jgi:hypothetical protein
MEVVMLRKLLLFIAVGLLAFPALSHAQQPYQFNPGDWTFTLSGSGLSSNDFDTNYFGFQGSVGYFIDPNLEVSLRQQVNYGDSDVDGATRLAIEYYLDMDRLKPFIGGSTGWIYGDNTRNSFILGVQGGARYFLNASTFLFGRLEYLMAVRDPIDEGQWIYNLGFGFRW